MATFQGIIFLALAGVAHVPYNPVLLLTLVGELLLLSFTLTAFGVMMAARIKQIQAFMALTQMFVMPLFFLSGALYPLNGLPSWLSVLTRVDPLTYIVDPMRDAVISHLSISPLAVDTLSPGITWNGWVVPLGLSLGIVAVMGAAMLAVAIAEFRKTESGGSHAPDAQPRGAASTRPTARRWPPASTRPTARRWPPASNRPTASRWPTARRETARGPRGGFGGSSPRRALRANGKPREALRT